MKSSLRIIPVLFAAATLANSQDEVSSVSSEPEAILAEPTTARILGEIPDGTPPQPAPPKPEYHVAVRDVLSTVTHEQGGRTITIREIKPIALPPPPPLRKSPFRNRTPNSANASQNTTKLVLTTSCCF